LVRYNFYFMIFCDFSRLIGVIVAMGMLTILLWKVFTTITDRREFAQFEQEIKKMKFNLNSNPIPRVGKVSIVIDFNTRTKLVRAECVRCPWLLA
jgi:hypothetical protein